MGAGQAPAAAAASFRRFFLAAERFIRGPVGREKGGQGRQRGLGHRAAARRPAARLKAPAPLGIYDARRDEPPQEPAVAFPPPRPATTKSAAPGTTSQRCGASSPAKFLTWPSDADGCSLGPTAATWWGPIACPAFASEHHNLLSWKAKRDVSSPAAKVACRVGGAGPEGADNAQRAPPAPWSRLRTMATPTRCGVSFCVATALAGRST